VGDAHAKLAKQPARAADVVGIGTLVECHDLVGVHVFDIVGEAAVVHPPVGKHPAFLRRIAD
jgi:hypothetical protein